MSATQTYDKLKSWVMAHNKTSVQCTDFTNTRNIQNAWAALADLQKLLQNESHDTVATYFADLQATLRLSPGSAISEDELAALERDWVAPTD